MTWLNDREDKESGRDWSDKNLKLVEVEQYYEVRFNAIEDMNLSIFQAAIINSGQLDRVHYIRDKSNHVLARKIVFLISRLVVCLSETLYMAGPCTHN